MFSKTFFLLFFIYYAENQLGFSKLGIFRKWVEVLNFCENFSKILIGLSPIYRLCICVGPLWHFKVVLRHFSISSCILHNSYALLHDRCLSKCPSDILVLNWTQVSSNDMILSYLIMFFMFWFVFVFVFHTLSILCLNAMPCTHQALSRHTSCITCCTHMHLHMLNTNTHMHMYLFYAL